MASEPEYWSFWIGSLWKSSVHNHQRLLIRAYWQKCLKIMKRFILWFLWKDQVVGNFKNCGILKSLHQEFSLQNTRMHWRLLFKILAEIFFLAQRASELGWKDVLESGITTKALSCLDDKNRCVCRAAASYIIEVSRTKALYCTVSPGNVISRLTAIVRKKDM